ncbi:MAG: hypothetical protein EPN48_16025 [Microbacteriaceae bacterium]|nr:MAG: hypothetical protein EPN48_16025 [Microbacteriaceae bacterium]
MWSDAGADGKLTDQPQPAASVLTMMESPVCDPSASPPKSPELTVTAEKSADGSAAFHSDSTCAAALDRSAALSAPSAPTGVPGAEAASR